MKKEILKIKIYRNYNLVVELLSNSIHELENDKEFYKEFFKENYVIGKFMETIIPFLKDNYFNSDKKNYGVIREILNISDKSYRMYIKRLLNHSIIEEVSKFRYKTCKYLSFEKIK